MSRTKIITAQKNKQINDLKSRLKHSNLMVVEKTEQIRQLGEKMAQQQMELSELRQRLVKAPSALEAPCDAQDQKV